MRDGIAYSIAACSLGRLLVAGTRRGVCLVRFGDEDAALEAGLRREFPFARVERDDQRLAPWQQALVDYADGRCEALDVPLDVRGSVFQRRVWDALRAIPRGETRSYSAVAATLGSPRGARAVARACAANPTALLIPCHRVVPRDGGLGGYAWGEERKRLLLTTESRPARAPAAHRAGLPGRLAALVR